MGVPKFYRWISERYPCLSEVVREYQIPEFDNLYLDMNGIIHVCSHPNDDDPHFRITEEKIFQDIFHYIEILFRLIRPQKVFFMAVDGVAPRAKMNQQRGRRFRSAREAEESEKRAVERGETLPSEERFDSNCITPGTEFMVKLHEQLKYFVTMKVSTDSLWKGIRIYLSGHETPGEGEHKIMDFIRSEKSKPDYDCNTRHCLYGLDADLIMLGLCTHEPHFSLLREEVRFGGKKAQKRTPTPEETTFHLLHLSLMRDYLELEFADVKEKLPFPYDLEKIIDDWVLMGFLVGNDFIPHLPQMHIAHDALPLLYRAYTEILPTLDGYINEGGTLNLGRFEKYLKRVAQYDYDHFKDNNADLKWFEGKKLSPNKKYTPKFRRKTDNMFDALANIDGDAFQEEAKHELLEKVGKLVDYDSPDDEWEDDEEDEELAKLEGDDLLEMEFVQHKRDYYMNKLEYLSVTPQVLCDQAECYVRAIQWNLHYYYDGVCSWSWYYPHHYAPYISDVKDFTHLTLDFELGKAFLPFQQLLAVLPAASKKLLPKPYQELMANDKSPVIDFYPVDFKTDLNGKQQDWEAVVLIPFINEKRLLDAMEPLEERLLPEEKNRNKHGPCLLYTYSERPLGQYVSPDPQNFVNVATNRARCQNIDIDAFRVDRDKLMKGLCPDVRLDVHFAGFPTLKHLKYKATLMKANVKVFQMNSRNDNMILRIVTDEDQETDLSNVAKNCLGKSIFVSWPHLVEAKIVAVTDSEQRIQVLDNGSKSNIKTTGAFQEEKLNDRDVPLWNLQCKGIQEHYIGRLGIEIGETKIVLSALPLMGRKYVCSSTGRVTLEKQWANHPVNYAYQTIVPDISAHDTTFIQYKTVEELFQPKTTCFMLDNPHYGCMGEVLEVQTKRAGLVTVVLQVQEEPNLEPIVKRQHILSINYQPGYNLAQRLGISSHLLSRVTGTFFVTPGMKGGPTNAQKINVGLNLKFNKKNKEVPGYTKKVDESWLYSEEAYKTMAQYLEKFPEMFEAITRYSNDSNVYAEDIFPDSNTAPDKLHEVQEWLKELPCSKAQHQQCGSDVLEEPVVKAIEEAVDTVRKRHGDSVQQITIQLKPRLLYLPSANQGSPIPDPASKYQLFDRVINVRPGFSVPLGLRGTVIGIHSAETESDVLLDVVFDEEFVGGLTLRSSPNRGYRVPLFSVLNLSHGRRQEQQFNRSGSKKIVANPHNPGSPPMTAASMSNRKRGGQNATTGHSNRVVNSGNNNQQLNQLNHSPNSPFVPRQGNSTAGDEFVSMWRQLQAASNGTGQQQFHNNNSLTLQNAAKVLPQVSNKVTDQNLNVYRSNRRGSKSDAVSTGQSMHSGSNKNIEDAATVGTTQLMQMLNIGEGKNTEKQKNEVVATATSQHARAPTKANQVPKNNGAPTTRTNSAYTPQWPVPGNQNAGLPGAASNRNAIWELLNLVQKLFTGGAPLYHYMTSGPNQLPCAQVKLPNGWTYYGYACRTREEAGESAARNALADLKQKLPYVWAPTVSHPPPWGVPGPGNFQRPVAPVAGMPPFKMPAVSRHPPPPTYPPPDQWGTTNVQPSDHYYGQLDNMSQLKQSAVPASKIVSNSSNSHLTDNRFIPMQVTMNNRAKQQSNSQCSVGRGSSSSSSSASSKVISGEPPPRHTVVPSNEQVPAASNAPQGNNSKPNQPAAPGPSKQQQAKSRQQRSRLAIRFNNPTSPE